MRRLILASPVNGWQLYRWKGKGMNKEQLKQCRALTGLTQEQAAESLGISLRHYQKLEAGHNGITETVAKLVGLIWKAP